MGYLANKLNYSFFTLELSSENGSFLKVFLKVLSHKYSAYQLR